MKNKLDNSTKRESSLNYWNNRTRWKLFSRILLKKGYVVHGIKRRSSSFNTSRIDHLFKDPHQSK